MRSKINIIGSKFNRLTITAQEKSMCTCICDCGKTTIVPRHRILSNHTKSCGCLQKDKLINRNNETKGIQVTKYGSCFGSIRKVYRTKGKTYDLTDDELYKLITSNCHYCDAIPSNVMKDTRDVNKIPFIYNGVDRVDNTLGYTLSNSVSCCKRCNIAKNDMKYSDFIDLCKRISDKHSI